MKLRSENLFVDELDGKWTLGFTDIKCGTESIANFNEEDAWLYPHDLRCNHVINVYLDEVDKETWHFNVYDLPENWAELVSQDGGNDGKPSMHDIMMEVS